MSHYVLTSDELLCAVRCSRVMSYSVQFVLTTDFMLCAVMCYQRISHCVQFGADVRFLIVFSSVLTSNDLLCAVP